jgi:hypothetical protein
MSLHDLSVYFVSEITLFTCPFYLCLFCNLSIFHLVSNSYLEILFENSCKQGQIEVEAGCGFSHTRFSINFFFYIEKNIVYLCDKTYLPKQNTYARAILSSCCLFITSLTLSTTHNHHHVAGHPATIVAHRRNRTTSYRQSSNR